nr:unnamed protein product [Naegleria fowleri]
MFDHYKGKEKEKDGTNQIDKKIPKSYDNLRQYIHEKQNEGISEFIKRFMDDREQRMEHLNARVTGNIIGKYAKKAVAKMEERYESALVGKANYGTNAEEIFKRMIQSISSAMKATESNNKPKTKIGNNPKFKTDPESLNFLKKMTLEIHSFTFDENVNNISMHDEMPKGGQEIQKARYSSLMGAYKYLYRQIFLKRLSQQPEDANEMEANLKIDIICEDIIRKYTDELEITLKCLIESNEHFTEPMDWSCKCIVGALVELSGVSETANKNCYEDMIKKFDVDKWSESTTGWGSRVLQIFGLSNQNVRQILHAMISECNNSTKKLNVLYAITFIASFKESSLGLFLSRNGK